MNFTHTQKGVFKNRSAEFRPFYFKCPALGVYLLIITSKFLKGTNKWLSTTQR